MLVHSPVRRKHSRPEAQASRRSVRTFWSALLPWKPEPGKLCGSAGSIHSHSTGQVPLRQERTSNFLTTRMYMTRSQDQNSCGSFITVLGTLKWGEQSWRETQKAQITPTFLMLLRAPRACLTHHLHIPMCGKVFGLEESTPNHQCDVEKAKSIRLAIRATRFESFLCFILAV